MGCPPVLNIVFCLCVFAQSLVDYLQMHRHVPLTFQEEFHDMLHSPYVTVQGDSIIRLNVPEHKGPANHFQVGCSLHAYYDVCIEVQLEIIAFANSIGDDDSPMFIGFISKPALESVKANDFKKATWQKTCYGGCSEACSLPNMQMYVLHCFYILCWNWRVTVCECMTRLPVRLHK